MNIKFIPKYLSWGQNCENATTWYCEQFGITIHNIVGCGNEFYLSCYDLGFSRFNLKTEDFDEAVEKAKWCVKQRIQSLTVKFDGFINSDGYEKTRW